jgi:hypothetical protein
MEPWMALQPCLDLCVLVGRVVVDDEMDVPVLWGLAIDLVEEADELLMPVALHALADDLALQDIQGREQRGRRESFVSDYPLGSSVWPGSIHEPGVLDIRKVRYDG